MMQKVACTFLIMILFPQLIITYQELLDAQHGGGLTVHYWAFDKNQLLAKYSPK